MGDFPFARGRMNLFRFRKVEENKQGDKQETDLSAGVWLGIVIVIIVVLVLFKDNPDLTPMILKAIPVSRGI